jgi:hypothetical protein
MSANSTPQALSPNTKTVRTIALSDHDMTKETCICVIENLVVIIVFITEFIYFGAEHFKA